MAYLKEHAKTDGFYTCKKCGSKHTTYFQMQTRGADEPMTNFITCINCGNKWKN
jgi:transcription elongation factor S-II